MTGRTTRGSPGTQSTSHRAKCVVQPSATSGIHAQDVLALIRSSRSSMDACVFDWGRWQTGRRRGTLLENGLTVTSWVIGSGLGGMTKASLLFRSQSGRGSESGVDCLYNVSASPLGVQKTLASEMLFPARIDVLFPGGHDNRWTSTRSRTCSDTSSGGVERS
jgi:hypothetical protein